MRHLAGAARIAAGSWNAIRIARLGRGSYLAETLRDVLNPNPVIRGVPMQFEDKRTCWKGVVVGKAAGVVRQLGVIEFPSDVQQRIEIGQVRVVTDQPDKLALPVAAGTCSIQGRRTAGLAI